MLNLAIAPHFQGKYTELYHSNRTSLSVASQYTYLPYLATLVEDMKANSYSLLVDGSSDTGLVKLNLLTVRIFDTRRSRVLTHLLDMCTTSERECGTSAAIFSKIDSVLNNHNILWHHCVAALVLIIPV